VSPMFPRSSEPITQAEEPSAYMTFGRSEWATLRSATRLTLSNNDLTDLRGLNDPIALDEVADIYLPLSRLLNLHIAAARNLGRVMINLVNLRENILPTRTRADIVLRKRPDDSVGEIWLRQT